MKLKQLSANETKAQLWTYRLIELPVLQQKLHTLGSNFRVMALAMQHLHVVENQP